MSETARDIYKQQRINDFVIAAYEDRLRRQFMLPMLQAVVSRLKATGELPAEHDDLVARRNLVDLTSKTV